MPEAGQAPDDQQVADLLAPGDPVAPQGDVQIVPEPAAQGDVPPPPKLGDRPGDIGVVEILQKVEAKHPADADGHVGVAGEVEVDLKGVGDDPQPGQAQRNLVRLLGEHPIGDLGKLVGQQDLLGQAEQEPDGARLKVRPALPPGPKLLCHGGVAHDGARHQLGEEGDVQGQAEQVLFCLGLPSEHVNGIAHALEGVEGDPDGQNDLLHRDPGEQLVKVLRNKAQVLEHEEQGQVGRHGQPHHQLAEPLRPLQGQEPSGQIVHQDGGQDDGHEPPAAKAVKHQAEPQQDQVAQVPPPEQGAKIHRQQQGEKGK